MTTLEKLERTAKKKGRSSHQDLVVRWGSSYGCMYLLKLKIVSKIQALEYLTTKSKRS